MITTFPSSLRYRCIIEECEGCCHLFEEIEIWREEIKRLKGLGYSDFWEKRGKKYFLKRPCPFLEGKLCNIHITHGYREKFSTCKKYPFVVVPLENGDIIIDIKWSCPGVGCEKGERLTADYIEEMLEDLDLERLERAPIKDVVYLSEAEGISTEWKALVMLYDFIGELLLSSRSPGEAIALLTSFVRYIARTPKEQIMVQKIPQVTDNFEPETKDELALQIPFEALAFSEVFEAVKSNEENIEEAAERLGLQAPPLDPVALLDKDFSGDGGKVYALYLSQSLKETLTRPWDLSTSYFWAMGVMGFADLLARGFSEREVGYSEMRDSIRIVDYLNKGFGGFRDYMYPLYPELGSRYLQFVLSF
jgi:ADP-ribose pyrophosphatase YjhB (NUDIX family)